MGGQVAQIVVGRRPAGLAGLVLVAPAPPTPMPAPEPQRAAMLASYQSREGGVAGAFRADRSAVAKRTSRAGDRGHPRCRARSEAGVDRARNDRRYQRGLVGVTTPTIVDIGDRDQLEHEGALRDVFARFLPHATFRVLAGVGHLSPLQAPDAIADACAAMLERPGLPETED